LHSIKAVSPDHSFSQRPIGWGWARDWEGTETEQLTPTDQRDIPYRMMSRSAIKAKRKEEEARGIQS